jgi:hypothetical protein
MVELCTPTADLVRRETINVALIELPIRTVAPRQWRLHSGPQRWRACKHAQGEIQRERLGGAIIWRPRGIAERKIREQEARHTDIFNN